MKQDRFLNILFDLKFFCKTIKNFQVIYAVILTCEKLFNLNIRL